jgi:hypothetical protein
MDGLHGENMLFLLKLLVPFIAVDTFDFGELLDDIIDTIFNEILQAVFDAGVTVGQYFIIGIGAAFDVVDMPVLIMIIILIGAGIALGSFGRRKTGPS